MKCFVAVVVVDSGATSARVPMDVGKANMNTILLYVAIIGIGWILALIVEALVG